MHIERIAVRWLGVMALAVGIPASVRGVDREVVDRVVAVIDAEVITLRELETKAAPYLTNLKDAGDAAAQERQRTDTLRRVLDIEISERIVSKEIEANKDRLGVTDADVDRAIQEVQRMNRLSEEQLQGALYAQGITWAEYRKKLRSQIERARLIQFQVQGKVEIKDVDVTRRCEERQRSGTQEVKVCASHILRKIPRDLDAVGTEQLRASMSKLQAELAAGADFAAYALKFSDDKSAPDGDLGCFGRGEMEEPFEKAAFALKVGDVSAVVRTSFGFHIVRVTDRRFPSQRGCAQDETLETFRNEIYQEEMDRQMNIWLSELRRKAFVDVRL